MRKRECDVHLKDSTQTERTQQRSDELFRALIENALDIIIILDPEGVIRYVSPSIERVLGYEPASLVDSKVAKLIHPDDLSRVAKAIKATVSHIEDPDRATIVDVRVRHKDGSWRFLEGIGKRLLGYPSSAGIVVNARRKRGGGEQKRSIAA
jgi:PAS domain S-box-containing protein